MKTNRTSLLFLLTMTILGVICYTGWHNLSVQASQTEGRKVRFYQDSMHPWIKSDHSHLAVVNAPCPVRKVQACEDDQARSSEPYRAASWL